MSNSVTIWSTLSDPPSIAERREITGYTAPDGEDPGAAPTTTLDVVGTGRATQGMPMSSQTANTKTLALTDNGYYIRCSNTTTITVTIPANATVAFPTGAEMIFFQAGSGNVLFANAAGVTLNSKESLVNLTGQYSAATLKKIATNTWNLIGDLA